MKAVLMSIRPQHLINILKGDKTIELRKRFPREYTGWTYLYCTKAIKGKPTLIRNAFSHVYTLDTCYIDGFQINLSGKVVARVWVDNVEEITWDVMDFDRPHYIIKDKPNLIDEIYKKSCLHYKDFDSYFYKNAMKNHIGYAIYLSKLEIFDKPKELGEFGLKRAPESYCYIEID